MCHFRLISIFVFFRSQISPMPYFIFKFLTHFVFFGLHDVALKGKGCRSNFRVGPKFEEPSMPDGEREVRAATDNSNEERTATG